jgi:hypothetical protein
VYDFTFCVGFPFLSNLPEGDAMLFTTTRRMDTVLFNAYALGTMSTVSLGRGTVALFREHLSSEPVLGLPSGARPTGECHADDRFPAVPDRQPGLKRLSLSNPHARVNSAW